MAARPQRRIKMIVVKGYDKPTNCYRCPGFSREDGYCKFDPVIDFDQIPYEGVPKDCPIVPVTLKEFNMQNWVPIDNSHDMHKCSRCDFISHIRTQYCPCCGAYMI